jgi:TRAP transporter 4TM/12TM fusion protein
MIYYIATLSTTPVTAAVRATMATVVISFLRRETWMGPRKILDAMENTAREAITIAIPCAMAGLLIGVVIYSGLGLKLTDILISFSGGILFVALIMVMVAVIILGMGMPTSAAYLIAAILMAPVLIKLGVIPLAAHMFIFYFAVISMITPPVALASYAAASIGEADLWETGVQAFKMALSGFLIPFALVYDPSLILEGSIGNIIWRSFITTIGVVALSAAMNGFYFRRATNWERAILFVAAIFMIIPELVTDFIGLFIIASITVIQLRRPSDFKRKESFLSTLSNEKPESQG